MKKIIFGILIVSLISISVYSAGIKIVAPKSGESLKADQPYFIKWNVVKEAGAKVKINIFRNSIAQSNYVEQIVAANNGSAKWVMSKKFTPGNYQIRIKSATDNKVFGDSGVFKIAAAPKTPPSSNPPSGPNPSTLPTIIDPNQLKPGLVKSNTIVLSELKSPQIVYFKPEKDTIIKGEAVLLYFHYKNASKARIFNRWTGKEILFTGKYPEFKSFIQVRPDTKTRYELIVTGGLKNVTREFYVNVKPRPSTIPQPVPGTEKLPTISFFKAVPDVVPFGKGTVLKLKGTNAKRIVIKDQNGKIVFNWSGIPAALIAKNIPVSMLYEKNTWTLEASNDHGNHFGSAWARWRSVIRDFSIKSVNKQKITFHYDYSLSEKSKIKHFNNASQKWITILELACYSTSCKGDKEVKYAPGKYKLVLLGKEGVFESEIVKVN